MVKFTRFDFIILMVLIKINETILFLTYFANLRAIGVITRQ